MHHHDVNDILQVQIGDVDRTARVLAAGRGMRSRIVWPEEGVGTETDGYRVQQALHKEFTCAGLRRGGWKIAVTAPPQYTALKLSRPGVGAILQRDIHASGVKLRMDSFVKVGIETEVAFRVGAGAMSAEYPLSDRAATSMVATVMPAFELIENRYQNLPGLDGPTRIADDFLQAACILGAEVRDWQALNLRQQGGVLNHDDSQLAICKADAACDSFAAFTFVANLLAELGTPLEPGEVVLTGTLHKPIFLDHTGQFKATLPDLGEVEVRLT